MLGSNLCVLSDIPDKINYKNISEDPLDPGGYFIINGGEKVVIAQERMNDNHIYLYHNKSGKYPYTCEIRSSRNNFSIVYATLIKWDRNDQIYITVKPGWSREDIPIFIVFRALGVLSDEDIIDLITHSRDKDIMTQMLTNTMLYDQTANVKSKKFPLVLSQEAALEYIAERSIPAHLRKKDKEYKIKYMMRIIRTNLLPHIDDDFRIKAVYLGYMVNKLLNGIRGKIDVDDRDNYANKRIDVSGILMAKLFNQLFNKMCDIMKNNLIKESATRLFKQHELETLIPRIVKSSIIEQGFKTSLSTW